MAEDNAASDDGYATAIGAAAQAHAADDFIGGVYLQSEEFCEQAKIEALQRVIEAGRLILSSRGFDAIEYNCVFP